MITGDFFDDVIIRYRTEKMRVLEELAEQEEANNINTGYAYINGEKMTFFRFQLLETNLSVMVPGEFIGNDTIMVTEKTIELFNHDKSVSLLFEILQHSTEEFLDFSYSESEDESHYHLDFENTQIKGTFTCVSYRVEDWKDLFFQIMNSIDDSQEGKVED